MEPEGEQVKQTLLQLLEDGRFEEAVTEGRDALQKFPDNAEITMLVGLALEQSGAFDEALPLLKRATVLSPEDPETFHNVAVSLYNLGDYKEAEIYAQEAIKLDPEHEKALETLKNCRSKKGQTAFEASGEKLDASEETILYPRGLEDKPNYVWDLGLPWTRIGFGLVGYCIVSFLFLIYHPFMDPNQAFRHDTPSLIAFFLYVTSGLAGGMWMLIDIIDRRERLVWLLPIWVCGLMALPALPLVLYLAVGRKVVQMG